MSSDLVVNVEHVSKCYQIYGQPHDRLMQMVWRGHKQFYREFWALKDVSFQIAKGETVGIIGRNGSGKSTLLQLICGTLSPTSGNVKTKGRIAALLELGAGFSPEFSGRDNVYMNASLLGLTKKQIDDRFDAIAAFADIGDFIEQPVKTYSSGMTVRLAFAVIAHVDADILIVDEALAVGDALFTQKCMRFIRKFREEHSLLFVSHDTASVINLCDRVIWLEGGCLVQQGRSKTVCESYLNHLLKDLDSPTDQVSHQDSKLERFDRFDENLPWRDVRQDFINASNLRNDIELFRFNEDDTDNYGGQEAKITDVKILDSNGCPLTWIVGGEKARLRIEADVFVNIEQPIMGFSVKDKLGQVLFGDNTFISYFQHDNKALAGHKLISEFEFFMPWLSQGDYIIQVAIATGTQDAHRQLHWMHDALVFRSHHNPVSTGIIGIPMSDIRLFSI